jgi:tetratricopeptide (TPR) repeat protein
MSAASAPKPDDPGDAEGWALLDSLRRRLDDHAAQSRKTQAQVTQLADSIAALVAEQRKRSRWLNVNSFVAYLVFTVLCGGAFYYVYQSRARELTQARDGAVAERDAADKRAADASAKLAAFEHQVTSEREQAAERAKQAESSQLDATWKAAQAAFRAGKFAEVAPPLEAALATAGPRAPELHYLAGLARGKTGDLDAAIKHLDAAVAGDVGEEDARFQLAALEDRAGQSEKARGDYQKFATAHPQSPFAGLAMRRSATLAHQDAPPAPTPPSDPAP